MSSTRAGHFGRRIRALREERGLSQEELARVFGFNDRQTVSAVETGARRLTAEELLLVMNWVERPLDYFTILPPGRRRPFLVEAERCGRA